MVRHRTPQVAVAEFHKAFGHPIGQDYTDKSLEFRFDLLEEEFIELSVEINNMRAELKEHGKCFPSSIADMLKEMADLQYVLSGLAVTFELPLEVAFARVHQSNMSKLDDDGKPVLRADGKVLKGPNYEAPFILDLVVGTKGAKQRSTINGKTE
jgi:predicted HAD superfamily Cof-like phosphohydrolase